MMSRVRTMSWRAVLAALVALLFVAGCGDTGSEVINGQNDGTDNPFLQNSTAEQQLPEGPHIRPEIQHVIIAEPDPDQVDLDIESATVTFTGAAAARVDHLGEDDILAIGDRSFQVDTFTKDGAGTHIGLRKLALQDVLYGKWDYEFALGEDPTQATASQELGSDEETARQGLDLSKLGCKPASELRDDMRTSVREEIQRLGADAQGIRPEVDFSTTLGSSKDFQFRGSLPLGVGNSDAEHQVQKQWCQANRGSQYCVREFQTMLTLEAGAQMNIGMELPFTSGFNFNPEVEVCNTSEVNVPGIPLGPHFELTPVFALNVGLGVEAQYPSPFENRAVDFTIQPGYQLNVPLGYHYLADTASGAEETHWAPEGFGSGPYKVNITANDDQFLTVSETEADTDVDPEVEAKLYVNVTMELVLSPTATDRVTLGGPTAGIEGGLYARWRPTQDGMTAETACMDTGPYVRPSLSVGLTAEADLSLWTWKYDIIESSEVWSNNYRVPLWWDEPRNFCFETETPSPVAIELQWQDENADLDLELTQPSSITYSNGVDSETGMEHQGDACPENFGVGCTDSPDGNGNFTEKIEVVNNSQAPDPGTNMTARVEHFQGDAPASFDLVIYKNGSVSQTLSGSVSPDGAETLSFQAP
ncbi:MAG: hypothetical protein ACQEVA_08705 [Myxococcota bacterium]